MTNAIRLNKSGFSGRVEAIFNVIFYKSLRVLTKFYPKAVYMIILLVDQMIEIQTDFIITYY